MVALLQAAAAEHRRASRPHWRHCAATSRLPSQPWQPPTSMGTYPILRTKLHGGAADKSRGGEEGMHYAAHVPVQARIERCKQVPAGRIWS